MSMFSEYLGGVFFRFVWQLWQMFGVVFLLAYFLQLLGSKIRCCGVGLFGRIYWYIVSPGVVCHETGHAVGCLVTGSRILEFVPFRLRGNSLGYVRHNVHSGVWGATANLIIATGPIWFGSIIVFVLTYLLVGDVSVGKWDDCFMEGAPSIVEYILALLFASISWCRSVFLMENPFSLLFWVWLYLAFCIASEIGLSKVDMANMWPGMLGVVIVMLLVNVIPCLGNAASMCVYMLMPHLFRLHVLMAAALGVNIIIYLLLLLVDRVPR